MERGLAMPAAHLRIRPPIYQDFGSLGIAKNQFGRPDGKSRGFRTIDLGIQKRFKFEDLGGTVFTACRGIMERAVPLVVMGIDIGAMLYQKRSATGKAPQCGPVQGRAPLLVPAFHLGTSREKVPGNRIVPEADCEVKG